MVKNLPVMPETQVQSLGQEDPPGEGQGSPQFMGSQRAGHDLATEQQQQGAHPR